MEYNHEDQPPSKKARVDGDREMALSDDDFDDADDFFEDTPAKPVASLVTSTEIPNQPPIQAVSNDMPDTTNAPAAPEPSESLAAISAPVALEASVPAIEQQQDVADLAKPISEASITEVKAADDIAASVTVLPTSEPLLSLQDSALKTETTQLVKDEEQNIIKPIKVEEAVVEATPATIMETKSTVEDVPQAVAGAVMTKKPDDPEFLEAAQANKEDRAAEWQYDSSDADSDDSSDSSNEDSDDDSDAEDYVLLDPREQARILMRGEGGSDDEGDGKKSGKGAQDRTANEQPDVVVEKPDIEVTPDMAIKELGVVEVIVENFALIKGTISAETQVLESGSCLCLEDRKVIGVVAEPIGRVEEPRYSVQFTNAAEIKGYGIAVGTKVFYVVSYSKYVFTQPLKLMKGTDASNQHDEELNDDEMEFSDDEAEAEYKKNKKQEKLIRKGLIKPDHMKPDPVTAPGATQPSNYDDIPLKYDDDEADDLYTPLARPTDLRNDSAPPRPSLQHAGRGGGERGRGRGRGRGDRGDRGRGDRGRGGRGRGGQQNGGHQNNLNSRPEQATASPQRPELVKPQASSQQPPAVHISSQELLTKPGQPHPAPQPFHGNFPPAFPGMPPMQQPYWNPALNGGGYSMPPSMPIPMPMPQQQPQFGVPPPGSYINPAFFSQYQQQGQMPHTPPHPQHYPQQYYQQQQQHGQQGQRQGRPPYDQGYNPNQEPWMG